MFKKILLGTAIAVVCGTACYAQAPASPPAYYQNWFTTAQSAYNDVKDARCYDGSVASAVYFLNMRDSSMLDWVLMAIDVGKPSEGSSDIRVSQASLDAIAAELPLAESELDQVRSWINALKAKPPCVEDKPVNRTRSVSLTPEQADQALRVLLGLPSREVEKEVHDLDKTLKDDHEAHKDLLNGDGKKADQQAPKTDSKVEQKTDEHSQRIEKTDAEKQVVRTDRVSEPRNVEARQSVSRVTPNTARINTARSFGSIHTGGFAAMHTGGFSGMHMAGIGGMRMGGFGGMHMGGLGGGFGGMHMGGGMHFGRM